MRVQIKDRELEIKYTFRAMLIYEKITDKSFMPTGLYDIVMFFYSSILASDKDLILTFDEFIDWIDENPYVVGEFSEWLTASVDQQNKLSATMKEKKSDSDKKKSKMKLKQTKSTD